MPSTRTTLRPTHRPRGNAAAASALGRPRLAQVAASGLASALVSTLLLAWRGRVDNGSAAAPNNAPSQYVHGRRALLHDGASWRYTAVGVGVHTTMSLLWSAAFELLQARRHRREPAGLAGAVADATLVTAAAALVDLRVVPDRFSPGFQHRLSVLSTALVYAAFAGGLVLARRR
jgi:hypothetical protein